MDTPLPCPGGFMCDIEGLYYFKQGDVDAFTSYNYTSRYNETTGHLSTKLSS